MEWDQDFAPLEVVADKFPLHGGLISEALGLFCLLGATVFWFGSVAAAWIVARPLLGTLLALVSIAALGGMLVLAEKYMAQREAAPEAS